MQVGLPILTDHQCEMSIFQNYVDTEKQVCATDDKVTKTCHGDSGIFFFYHLNMNLF